MWKKFLKIATIIGIVGMSIFHFNQKKEFSKQYDLPENEILSEYRKQNSATTYMTILEEKRFEAKIKSFCGNDDICHISVPEKAVLHISCKNNSGEGKLLFENKAGQIPQTVKLENEQMEVVLDADEYDVFLVGKWFRSKVVLQSEDIMFRV